MLCMNIATYKRQPPGTEQGLHLHCGWMTHPISNLSGAAMFYDEANLASVEPQ
jgi:hypothetical protein